MSNNSNPKVSVIIPLYNQERFFGKCIKSICGQTYQNLEIIIINDGSTDNSLSIAKDWAQKDSRIVVINKVNQGAARARMDGMEKATGELLSFVDSDDWLPRDAISILARHIIEKDVDLVIGSWARTIGFIKRYHDCDYGEFPFHQVVKQPELFEKYYPSFFGKNAFPITLCARLYRKSIVDKAFQETELISKDIVFMGEDRYFNMQLFPYLRSMYRTDENVYFYRYGGGSLDRFNPHYTDLFVICEKSLDLLDQYSLDGCYHSIYESYAIYLDYHVQQLLEYGQVDKDGAIAFIKDECDNRRLISRMKDYYENNKSDHEVVKLILKKDYEGMYEYSLRQMNARCNSWKYKIRKVLMPILESL